MISIQNGSFSKRCFFRSILCPDSLRSIGDCSCGWTEVESLVLPGLGGRDWSHSVLQMSFASVYLIHLWFLFDDMRLTIGFCRHRCRIASQTISRKLVPEKHHVRLVRSQCTVTCHCANFQLTAIRGFSVSHYLGNFVFILHLKQVKRVHLQMIQLNRSFVRPSSTCLRFGICAKRKSD
jgi:hypothetical protein